MTKAKKPSKKTLLEWVKHLDRMGHDWFNNGSPGKSFVKQSKEIQEYLEDLLLEDGK